MTKQRLELKLAEVALDMLVAIVAEGLVRGRNSDDARLAEHMHSHGRCMRLQLGLCPILTLEEEVSSHDVLWALEQGARLGCMPRVRKFQATSLQLASLCAHCAATI